MDSKAKIFRALLAALIVTVSQILIATALIAPGGPFSFRYDTLIQHDSFWFANIVDRGFGTTVPPSSHKLMEVCNVAFFPAYPLVAALFRYGLHLSTSKALLITAQAAGWGFWSYFFLFCQRWNVSAIGQFFGALAILAHPAAFFLVAGYSESLFLLALLGFLYWSTAEGAVAKILAVVHGYVMTATRIVGIPCALFPVVRALLHDGWRGWSDLSSLRKRIGPALWVAAGATMGAASFFLYCFIRWGRWDMYMLTQQAGWAIVPDYLAIFRLENYHWLFPSLRDPTQASQMAMTLGLLFLAAVLLCELLPAVRRNSNWKTRVGFYFSGAVIYYTSVSAVASVQMESMLRYEFCLHALLVLALIHLCREVGMPGVARSLAFAGLALFSAAGFALQTWYVWNFTRGKWVA
jgi:hypothetical protein